MRCLAVTVLFSLFAFGAAAQKPKPRPASAKPKPAATPKKKVDEQAEWDKATSIADPAQRIAALKQFIKTFPKSAKLADATMLLVTVEYGYANDKLVAGEIDDAADLYTAAVNDAPKPVPDEMWSGELSKIAPNLYFRGARGEALDIAKLLEDKADANVPRLLSIANFYLSIENGGEAKRVAEAAIKLDPNSSAAYQTLALGHRMDFELEDSAAAFAKALELDPSSITARRGLAEMQRSLWKADEAAALYREILAKDETNVPARTGLILSLLDAEKRADAEAELAKALEANSGNVILLAGVAYWYAAHNEGDKAVDYAQRAIAADPRFIWSHIALARGYLVQNRPVEAEKTLLAARRYGNFPTLEYEIASARLAAGLYREAAEELATSFTVKDGVIHVKLGGRVARESKYFTELIGFERRASIFAPTAADNPESSAQLRALLEFQQALSAAGPDADSAAKAADEFILGDDKMKVHRQLFAASQLLDKKIALPKVLDIIKTAPQNLDAGLDLPDAATAVLASELYESRKLAAAREDYVAVPTVPRATLSAVLRGRIEDVMGWAYYQVDDHEQAAVHLRRAVSVLPADSSYLRASLWRLGTALLVSGKEADALDAYIRSYKGGPPDAVRYSAIEAIYKRVNGSTDGLEAKIGPDPAPATVAQAVIPSPVPTPSGATDQTLPTPNATPAVEAATPSPTPTVEATPPSPTPAIEAAKPTSTPGPTLTPERTQPPFNPSIVPIATPVLAQETPSPGPTPEIATPSPTPVAATTPTTDASPMPTPDATSTAAPTSSPTPTAEASPTPTSETTLPSPTPTSETPNAVAKADTKELFPPVVITIPAPEKPKPKPTPLPAASPAPEETKAEAKVDESKGTATTSPEPAPAETPSSAARPRFVDDKPVVPDDIRPCSLTVSDENVTLQTGGSDRAIIIGRSDNNELEGLTAVSASPENVSVSRKVIEGIRTRALFVLHPGSKAGVFTVTFEMPCGKREIAVRVK